MIIRERVLLRPPCAFCPLNSEANHAPIFALDEFDLPIKLEWNWMNLPVYTWRLTHRSTVYLAMRSDTSSLAYLILNPPFHPPSLTLGQDRSISSRPVVWNRTDTTSRRGSPAVFSTLAKPRIR